MMATIPTYIVPQTGEIRQPHFAIGPNVISPDSYSTVQYITQPTYDKYTGQTIQPPSIFAQGGPLQAFIQNNQWIIWGAGGIVLFILFISLIRR